MSGYDFDGMFATFGIVCVLVGGLLFIGGEHLVMWLWSHVHITWAAKP